jgi:hypothetical protein
MRVKKQSKPSYFEGEVLKQLGTPNSDQLILGGKPCSNYLK